jgi:iron complex transport system substrate-binding protein
LEDDKRRVLKEIILLQEFNLKKSLPLIIILLFFTVAAAFSLFLSLSPGGEEPGKKHSEKEGGIVITDDLGYRVELPAPAERIVSTYSANTETLIWLGAEKKLAGVGTHDIGNLKVPGVGSHIRPDIEAILACRPDLVILSATRKSVYEKLKPVFVENRIPVAALYPDNVAGVFKNIERLSKLTGVKPDREKLKKMTDIIDSIRKKVDAIPKDKRKRIFFEVNSLKLLTCGRESFVYDVILHGGGIPISDFKMNVHPFDLERLIAADPDYYLIQKGAMNRSPVSPEKRKVIQNLKCIKNGNWSIVDETLISRPGPNVAEAVKTIYNLLYGEKR